MEVVVEISFYPFLPTVAFSQPSSNICCPRDCVSRHNGAPLVPPLNPTETIVLSEHYRLWGVCGGHPRCPHSKCWNSGHEWVKKKFSVSINIWNTIGWVWGCIVSPWTTRISRQYCNKGLKAKLTQKNSYTFLHHSNNKILKAKYHNNSTTQSGHKRNYISRKRN